MRGLLTLAVCSSLVLFVWACTDAGGSGSTISGDAGPGPLADGGDPSVTLEPTGVDLGSVPSGVDTPFDVPQGTIGFVIIADGPQSYLDVSSQNYGIETIKDPTGKTVHDKFTPVGGIDPTSLADVDTIVTAAIPQGEGTAATPGRWTLRIGVQGGGGPVSLKTKVRFQGTGDGQFHGGSLDLHLHVPDGLKVGTTTLSAAQAGQSPELKQRIDSYFTLLSQLIGLDRGEVLFQAADSTLASIDSLDTLAAGFGVSAGTPEGTQRLPILLTNRIAPQGKIIGTGLTPTIPAAAGVFGRVASGIILTITSDPQFDAVSLLHETGHFVGLNHTTEYGGTIFDPLSDTPQCPGLSSSWSTDQQRQCADKSNVMFPPTALATPIEVSPSQLRVYRGSSIYKAYPAGSPKAK